MPSFFQHSKWKLVTHWRHMLALHCILMLGLHYPITNILCWTNIRTCNYLPRCTTGFWPKLAQWGYLRWLSVFGLHILNVLGSVNPLLDTNITAILINATIIRFFLHVLSTFYFYSYMYWAGRTIKTNNINLALGKKKYYKLS